MSEIKTFPMSQYASSKHREQAIFEYIQSLQSSLAAKEEEIKDLNNTINFLRDEVSGLSERVIELTRE